MKTYMGHFGSMGEKKSDYYGDEENTNFYELYPLRDKVFETYSNDPFENYRYEMREPAMIPVKRSFGVYEDVKYYYGNTAKPIESAALLVEEKVNSNASNSPSVIVQEQVKQIQEMTTPENKTGRNILLGVGAGIAALFLLNR